ncbi:hypothetical protein QAD02_015603 [Eretmocerus hayati]|uniref:Uncharacterized protein n=1 Tax=Eretmocerus hayati TaxID=131215 RepID=A0ACC2P9Z2_9HYME|nr:hypothetical protein QAD02_015603 [Eretmocerus hayati]
MVLSLYTKSIAYAPLDSEELALALSSRSSLWLHMQKYDLCLIDIDRALSITKSKDLAQELSTLREKCLNHGAFPAYKNRRKEFKLPNITHPPNSVSCTADCIKLEWSEKYGRHYVATRDIKPGEVVLCEKTSYACVDIEQMYLVCAHCLAFAWVGVPCDFCVFTVYCSETCKSEAWFQYHDVICAMFSIDSFSNRILSYERDCKLSNPEYDDLSSGVFMVLVRMMILIIKREGLKNLMVAAQDINQEQVAEAKKSLTTCANSTCSDFNYICSLMPSEKNVEVNLVPILMWAFEQSSDTFLGNYDNAVSSSLKSVSEKLYKIIMSNSSKFAVYDCFCKDPEYADCISIRGSIFAPCSALFNHSCENNIDGIFLPGPRATFFANQPIEKGKQLFICYGPSASMRKEMRHAVLANNYSFKCDCIACIENWPLNYDSDRSKVSWSNIAYYCSSLERSL